MTPGDFVDALTQLPSIRPGPAWHEGESPSMICLDLLLNQRVGVERSSAVACALHDHFRRPLAGTEAVVSEATAWPYDQSELRPQAKSVLKLITEYLQGAGGAGQTPLGQMPSFVVGGLASLERYYNRTNKAFDPVWAAEITATELRDLTTEAVRQISAINLPAANLTHQLASTATVLDMRARQGWSASDLHSALRKLPRIGDEAADTLMVYLFGTPAVIVDEYLRRIAYRHYLLDNPRVPTGAIRRLFAPHLSDAAQAHRFHAHIDDLGVTFCLAAQPHCATCPLAGDPHRL